MLEMPDMPVQDTTSLIRMPEWTKKVWNWDQYAAGQDVPILKDFRYLAIYGGRGGSKTWSYCDILVVLGSIIKLNVVCGREFQVTIEDSVKVALERSINNCGLSDKYIILANKIIGLNGTIFRFKGLNRNISNIKGWEDVDICWVEEAHTMSGKSLELLRNTVRKPGSVIWFSWNRNTASDAVDEMFLGDHGVPPRTILLKINYYDNPFFPQELEDERQLCLKTQPDRYPHIWEGEIDTGSGKHKVLPYELIMVCVDAHKKLGIEVDGMRHAGLDVGDAMDGDPNAYGLRKGSLLEDVTEWHAKYLWQTAGRADFKNRQNGVVRMYYDATGIGAGIKSELSKVQKNPEDGSGPQVNKFIPFHNGGSVYGKNKVYVKSKGESKILNKDFFAKANSQLWWNFRLRAQNTMTALDQHATNQPITVNLDRCLFISKDIPDLKKLLVELSQCVYDDSTGKIKVDKQPKGTKSPNLAEGALLAFAADFKKGLKA